MQYQVSKSRQDLVVSNSKLSNQDIVIPRLELIATHIVTRLVQIQWKASKITIKVEQQSEQTVHFLYIIWKIK